jgi:hypothetical protein
MAVAQLTSGLSSSACVASVPYCGTCCRFRFETCLEKSLLLSTNGHGGHGSWAAVLLKGVVAPGSWAAVLRKGVVAPLPTPCF